MKYRLAVYDLASGQSRTVLETEAHIEAPNWHPSGYLIVNSARRLYRVDLSAPALDEIDTGFATRLNNDHGISPDGTKLAISNHTEDGKSCIYTLPVTGGTPRRVTTNVPSWWHGWSPDGARLAYPAVRDGQFDIYTIPVEGGAETRVTDGSFTHTDGPDYSPDGQWICFNGARDGAMDLWRIHPDGSGLERMTDGDTVDWFPHPSPDGQHVLFLAYAPGTEGHPAERDVELRLMPATGGASRRLLTLFGGQGTINVPCWAPDSTQFAYVELIKPEYE